jgi:hypothetical protein
MSSNNEEEKIIAWAKRYNDDSSNSDIIIKEIDEYIKTLNANQKMNIKESLLML